MLEPLFAADERLVRLNDAGELAERARFHGEPDTMKHELRTLLRDAYRPTEFIEGNAVLGIGNKPDRCQPLIQP